MFQTCKWIIFVEQEELFEWEYSMLCVWGFGFFSYSHFFLLSSIGGTNVTAEFVNLIDVRGTVTQATTYNKQQDCNKHIAVLGIRGRKCANNNAVGVSLTGR